MKKKGLISFSGGETSGYMLWWLLTHKQDEYDFTVLFANTGRENNETLDFVKRCGDHFGVDIVWLEAVINPQYRKGTKHKIVTYETATRNQDWKVRQDTPYEMMIKKYGLANISSRISTRELKERPIHSYMKSIGYKLGSYDTFIGIRVDEFDRMSAEKGRYSLMYPLIKWKPVTKPQINFWWSVQPFRLELQGWEGNCVTCYKKSIKKLTKIMQDDPWKFEFDEYLEDKYGYYIPPGRLAYLEKNNKPLPEMPIRIFREKTTVLDLRKLAEEAIINIKDDTLNKEELDDESCEVFSQCGINN